jgi:hypothetical protein
LFVKLQRFERGKGKLIDRIKEGIGNIMQILIRAGGKGVRTQYRVFTITLVIPYSYSFII